MTVEKGKAMHPTERRDRILAFLHDAGELSVDQLAVHLGVSRETIRRDLAKLDGEGRLRKYHGGARALPQARATAEQEGPFAIRIGQNIAEKQAIAAAVCALLKPEDAIFIDTGSTTIMLAEPLAKLPSLVVITNSPQIAATVATPGHHKVFLIGGAYSADAGESVGPLALEQIARFRARYAILTIGAIDEGAIMDYDLQEAEVAKAMIERADKVIVLADHSKFERRAVFEIAALSRIQTLVTDRPPPEGIAAALREAGVSVIVCS